jgi:hypothetical protein
LSSHNHQVYYNNKNKHNLSDAITDGYLAAGKLKDTTRYKESHKILRVAKEKYKPINTTVSGHSLGGSIAGYIASKGDKVFTLGEGATLFQPVKKNENAYRTSSDLVSLLNANSKHMKTLKNNNFQTGILPIDVLNAQNMNNIKDKKYLFKFLMLHVLFLIEYLYISFHIYFLYIVLKIPYIHLYHQY